MKWTLMAALLLLPTTQASARKERFFREAEEYAVFIGELSQNLLSAGPFGELFSIPEPGQPEDPATGKAVYSTSIESSTLLWRSETEAILFAKAIPPTQSTQSAVAALFLLEKHGGVWRIRDLKRFAAFGKYAFIEANLTAEAGRAHKEALSPVITIRQQHGGRGYTCSQSASYSTQKGKWARRDLEELPPPKSLIWR